MDIVGIAMVGARFGAALHVHNLAPRRGLPRTPIRGRRVEFVDAACLSAAEGRRALLAEPNARR